MRSSLLFLLPITFLLTSGASLFAQTPPPPPPPDENDNGSIPENIDLSKVPIPEEDKKESMVLTEEEKRGPQISISIMPVGFVPPPIIYLDKSGMPREKYRNPLEYAPAVYHVKTRKGTLRLIGSQNNLGPGGLIPRRETLTIYREKPMDEDASSSEIEKGPRLSEIGTVTIPKTMTHGVIVLSKDPSAKLWRKIAIRLVDLSPSKQKINEVRIINMSRTAIGLSQKSTYSSFRPGSISTHTLEPSKNGAFYYALAASTGKDWHRITHTGVRLRKKEQLVFVGWPMPKSSVIPTGAAVATFQFQAKPIPPYQPKRSAP